MNEMPHWIYIQLKAICIGNLCGQPSCIELHIFPIIYNCTYEYNVFIATNATWPM
jgi:hypothetical protein